MTDSASCFAVEPKRDCPHIITINFKDISRFSAVKIAGPCYECKDASENWMCTTCAVIGCSSYKKGHMKVHSMANGHPIVLSFSDMSFWCYLCDSYITSPSLKSTLAMFQEKKFPRSEDPTAEITQKLESVKLEEKKEPEVPKLTLEQLVEKIKKGECKKIVALTGAGISVNAGIPDFRTPGTGLYSQLEKFKLPFAEAIFTIEYFKDHPEPFCELAKEMFAKKFVPTKAHYFLRLLQEKKILIRNYTQNIDNLEEDAGIKSELLVQAHGTYTTSHCIACKKLVDQKTMMEHIKEGKPMRCECTGLCKPDIVFFGESLPAKFFANIDEISKNCDLLLVMGSSLVVMPFCLLATMTEKDVPRLVLNIEHPEVFATPSPNDIIKLGDCDKSIDEIVKLLGWNKEFEGLMKEREAYAKKHGLSLKKEEKKAQC